jgi:hypothetical protein
MPLTAASFTALVPYANSGVGAGLLHTMDMMLLLAAVSQHGGESSIVFSLSASVRFEEAAAQCHAAAGAACCFSRHHDIRL